MEIRYGVKKITFWMESELEVCACGCCGIKKLIATSYTGQTHKSQDYNWEEINIINSKNLLQPLIVQEETNSYSTVFEHGGTNRS